MKMKYLKTVGSFKFPGPHRAIFRSINRLFECIKNYIKKRIKFPLVDPLGNQGALHALTPEDLRRGVSFPVGVDVALAY